LDTIQHNNKDFSHSWRQCLPDSQANVFDVSSQKIIATACFLVSRGIRVMFLMLWSSVICGRKRQNSLPKLTNSRGGGNEERRMTLR